MHSQIRDQNAEVPNILHNSSTTLSIPKLGPHDSEKDNLK